MRVFDDYAHHPTEIAATLRAARDVVGTGHIRVAFQAHHYYRTAMYLQEFGQALGSGLRGGPGGVRARRSADSRASGQGMADAVPLPAGQVVFEPSWSAVATHLAHGARAGDIVMTLGPGTSHC